jgi:hypothetical protein
MTKLSDTQRRILKAASKEPKSDVRKHMQDLKSPAIRDKVVTSMLNNGLVVEDLLGHSSTGDSIRRMDVLNGSFDII